MIVAAARDIFERIARFADRHSPQTLFARALIIIVVPMLLLQALSAWWFYSQRGDNVTNRLAILLVRDLRMLIALLRALGARLGEVLSREALCKTVGGGMNERAIDVQVTRLRRKIEPDPGFPRYLRTVRGQGYRLVNA